MAFHQRVFDTRLINPTMNNILVTRSLKLNPAGAETDHGFGRTRTILSTTINNEQNSHQAMETSPSRHGEKSCESFTSNLVGHLITYGQYQENGNLTGIANIAATARPCYLPTYLSMIKRASLEVTLPS